MGSFRSPDKLGFKPINESSYSHIEYIPFSVHSDPNDPTLVPPTELRSVTNVTCLKGLLLIDVYQSSVGFFLSPSPDKKS